MVEIAFNGRLTIEEVPEAILRLQEAIREAVEVSVDLTAVESVDSAAVQMLLAARKECGNKGKAIRYIVSSPVKDTLKTMGVTL